MPVTWLTAQDPDLATYWPESDTLEVPALTIYLDAAREACEAYAPTLADGQTMPAGWRLAQALQARNNYNASNAGPSGDMDGGAYGLTVHPLDWTVKQLLRPARVMGPIA